jgi:hypothetical protein
MTALADFFAPPNKMEVWSRKNRVLDPAHPDEIDLRVRE